jgi:phage terminase large subunit GpA-like protein
MNSDSMIDDVDHGRRAAHDVAFGWKAMLPSKRLTVSQSAAQNLYFSSPGQVAGFWDSSRTPYMVEPMDVLMSRRHESEIFVGPARTGKSAALLLGLLTHAVTSDPGDMLIVQMTEVKARDFSKSDIKRALASDNLKAELTPSKHADNVYDKVFRNGTLLKIGWPTIANLSSSSFRYGAVTDLDRIVNREDVDGEGPLFNLLLKRTQTYKSRGMALAESSPGGEITDPNFIPSGAHEGPNVTGIIGLYNAGDRRRWYWKCPLCGYWFEPKPDLSLFELPPDDVLIETIRDANIYTIVQEHNRIICPHNRCQIGPKAKYEMNLRGRWLREGHILTCRDELIGTPRESASATFWLGGIAAAYQSWASLLEKHLNALRHYAVTGEETQLKTTTNVDQGACYMSRRLLEAKRTALDPAQRKEPGLIRYVCPEETRFIAAAVDIQGGRNPHFVVQVHAVGPYLEQWPIDRFSIRESMREGTEGPDGPKAPLDPARYAEDWDLITEKVLRATYRTQCEGIELRVRMTAVDSGGEDGVTDKAYDWSRRARAEGFGDRFILVKGEGKKSDSVMAMIVETWVGGRSGKEVGDIQLFRLNSNKLKDAVDKGLKRPTPGPGYIHIPAWMTQSMLDEFGSEIRQENGTWVQIRARNEAFDCSVYIRACCLRLGVDHISWLNPPSWAEPMPDNSDCVTSDIRRELQENTRIDWKNRQITPATPKPAPARRVVRSNYMNN